MTSSVVSPPVAGTAPQPGAIVPLEQVKGRKPYPVSLMPAGLINSLNADELLNLLGLNIEWIAGPVSNCYMKGNHLGLEPHTIVGNLEYMLDDIETVTGKRIKPSFNRKGAEILKQEGATAGAAAPPVAQGVAR